MQRAVFGMDVARSDGGALYVAGRQTDVLAIEQPHLTAGTNGRIGRSGDVVADEELLYRGVTTVGLHKAEQRILVERTVDRRKNRERLSAIEQLGIAHRRAAMVAEDAGLLQHFAEIAELGVGLQAGPQRLAAGGVCLAVVMVGPVAARRQQGAGCSHEGYMSK